MATLIFDFDGTIADTLTAIVRITNRLAPAYGFTPTTPDRLAYLRTLTPQQLLEQSEIPLFRVPFLIRRVRRELRHDIHQLTPITGLPEVLHQLAQNHNLLIVSSNSTRNIHQFLTQHELAHLFEGIHANVGLLGKARRLRKILSRLRLSANQVLYVGDETRDVVSAHEIGLPVAAVGWGFSSISALAAQHPTFMATAPAQLLDITRQLSAAQTSPTCQPHQPPNLSMPDDQTMPQSSARP